MFSVVDNLVTKFPGLLLVPCVEVVLVKNTTVFIVFTASNNDILTSSSMDRFKRIGLFTCETGVPGRACIFHDRSN